MHSTSEIYPVTGSQPQAFVVPEQRTGQTSSCDVCEAPAISHPAPLNTNRNLHNIHHALITHHCNSNRSSSSTTQKHTTAAVDSSSTAEPTYHTHGIHHPSSSRSVARLEAAHGIVIVSIITAHETSEQELAKSLTSKSFSPVHNSTKPLPKNDTKSIPELNPQG